MPKKICLLIDSLGAGGAQRQLVGLATMLKDNGYDVTIVTYHSDNFYATHLDDRDIKWLNVDGAYSYIKRIRLVKKALKEIAPNVVISYLENPSIIASVLKIIGGKWKLIVSERNTNQSTCFKDKIRFNLFRIADYVVTNSYSQKKYIDKQFGFLSKKNIAIPNFVDIEKFRPSEEKIHNPRKEIIIVASVWWPKNTKNFIEAVRLLKEKNKNFHIRWYGLSETIIPYQKECMEMIERYDLKDEIELLPKTTNIDQKYRESDIFCLPSFYEGTPNVLCEAIASGLPVAVSNVCDNSIYVRESINGVLFDPHSIESIASSLEKILLQNDQKLMELGRNSRKIAEEKFSKEQFLQKYNELIIKLQ